MTTNRILAAIRLSVKTDETTSPERQDAAIKIKADQLGGKIVGVASDLNVSASKVQPFLRPQLGEWLNNRAEQFDTIIWWRMDRAIRSMTDFHRLVQWAIDNKKCLVFCEGPGSEQSFDFSKVDKSNSSSLLVVIATIIAWAAEVESQAISERVTSSHAYLRKNGEWGGGRFPYGLIPERIEGKIRGWQLVHCLETYTVVRRIVDCVLRGDALRKIAKELNEEGVLAPLDWWAKYRGKKTKGITWKVNTLKVILQSRALLGETLFDGKLVVDENGEPVARSKAMVSEDEFIKLRSKIAERLKPNNGRRYSQSNTLLGVAFCARCGSQYYHRERISKYTQNVSRVFECASSSSHGVRCKQPVISVLYAQETVSRLLLTLVGKQRVTRRQYVPGDDRSEELAFLRERERILRREFYEGLFSGTEDEYFTMLRDFKSRIEEIGPEPVTEARYEYIDTGKTYNQLWPELDWQQRLDLLIELGVRVYLGREEASHAEAAYSETAENADTHSRWLVLNEPDVDQLLEDVQDGKRVKKDFRVWFNQSHERPLHEVLT